MRLVRTLSCALILGALFGLSPPAEARNSSRPNVIVILADDIGDAGLDKAQTPHIDSIAQSGAVYTDSYGAPLCVPARLTLLTGRYAAEFDVTRNQTQLAARADAPTLAERLRLAGYRTAMVGKWGLGDTRQHGNPLEAGFDTFLGYERNVEGPYFGDDPDVPLMRDHTKIHLGDGYSTDVFADEAVRLLRQDSAEPLFLYLAFNAAHEPYPEKFGNTKQERFRRVMSDMDDAIGRVLAATDDHDIVIFAADNGQGKGLNNPFRGGKQQILEGGIRIPLMLRAPGEHGVVGTPVSLVDVSRTVLSMLNLPVQGTIGYDISSHVPADRVLTFDAIKNGGWAVRKGDWKLMYDPGEDDAWALYNLADDQKELRNLAGAHPDIVQELKRERAEITSSW